MILIPMYGRRAMVLHDGRESYHTVNGVLRVPANLVPRALDAGFSRQPFADMAPVDEEPEVEIDPNATSTLETGIAGQVAGAEGAVALSGLPPEHPQSAETTRHAEKSHAAAVAAGTATTELDELAAAEERLRNAR